MNLIFFDDHSWENLLPLTYTKPAAELRVGILKIREKWERLLEMKGCFMTHDYLQTKYTTCIRDENLLVNGTLLPDNELVGAIRNIPIGGSLKKGNTLLAAATSEGSFDLHDPRLLSDADEYEGSPSLIDFPWKLFSLNGQEIAADLELLTKDRESAALSKSVKIIGNGQVFVENGFKGECFTLNTTTGPIYLGKDAEIMEGSVIRGPFALCDHATIKMGTKIYGPTTIGPHSKAGGEINNSILQAYSNKGHDGFLGNAVIGEWCNLGADTNNSNLKNNYSEVKIWNYPKKRFIRTGLQFCGLIMGDHSKCAINTMFNTGTVVGVSANIFGAGFPRNFIPSFSWGGDHGMSVYKLEKAFETMELVMERRDVSLSEEDREIFQYIFERTQAFRERF